MDDEQADVGPPGRTIEELITLIELQQELLSSVATGGPPIKTVDWIYKERRNRIRRGLREVGVDDPFPWATLWDWYGFWQTLGGYALRRGHVDRLASVALDALRVRQDSLGVADWGEGTVEGLEHRIDGLKATLETAQDLDDYQDVGRRSREILIGLASIAFHESMVASGKPIPGSSDAKARLDIFFDRRFPGKSNEEMRRFMKSAVALANSVTHSDDTAGVHAYAVAQATVLLVRVVSKLDMGPLDDDSSAAGLLF